MRLRPFIRADFDAVIGWLGTPEAVVVWAGMGEPFPVTKAYLAALLAETRTDPPDRLGFTLVDGDRPVAHCQAVFDHAAELARLGRVVVDPARRGRGLGKALVADAVDAIFERMPVHRLELVAATDNPVAENIYRQVGFRDEGIQRDVEKFHDRRISLRMMSILRPEWVARKQAGAPADGHADVQA